MKRLMTTALLMGAVAMPAASETIQLKGGDVINAPITAQDDASITINHPSLGELKISRDKIDAIYTDTDAKAAADKQAADDAAATKLQTERDADKGIFWGSGFLKGWNRRLDLGLNGAEGNSENLNFRIAFHGDYENTQDRWIYDMVYRRSTSSGSVTENNFNAALTKDWLFPDEDYFFFANGVYDWDDQQDWEHRVGGFGGVGYQIAKNDKWDAKGRAGLGGSQEFGSVNEAFTTEALIGAEASYQIADNQSISATNTLYPSLEEAGDFRNITTVDYVIAIDRDKGMDLRIGVANEHDSNVAAGTKRNDFDYYITLGWEF